LSIAPPKTLPPTPQWGVVHRLLRASCAAAAMLLMAGALLQIAMIRFTGDRWWLGTVLMFAPRWPLLWLIGATALLCALVRPRLLWACAAAAAIVAWPLMGWQAPWPWRGGLAAESSLRVLSINAGGGASLELLRQEIVRVAPDVIAIQETPSELAERLFGPEWEVISERHLTLASRWPIEESAIFDSSQVGRWVNLGMRARIAAPAGSVWVASVYLESPREGFEELMLTRHGLFGAEKVAANTERRSRQSAEVSRWLGEVAEPLIVMGDFNQPPESALFRRDWGAFQDAFLAAGSGYGYSWFSRWHGARIDRILASGDWSVEEFAVGQPTGGDHRAVVARMVLNFGDRKKLVP
jgi:vancomycin resistance protein VanJ